MLKVNITCSQSQNLFFLLNVMLYSYVEGKFYIITITHLFLNIRTFNTIFSKILVKQRKFKVDYSNMKQKIKIL